MVSMSKQMSGSSSMAVRTSGSVLVLVTYRVLIGGAEPLELLDFLLQLDHLELTPHGQPLEVLELRQALQRFGLLFGELLLGPVLFINIAGRGEHPQDLPAAVAVDRGVVQDLGQRPILVAHG